MVCAWERDPENAQFVQVWPEELHRAALIDPTQRHLVIEAGGRAVGFVILAGLDGVNPVVEFRRVVVAEKGRGIGQATVALVVQYSFTELGAREVWLDFVEHNARARYIYEKLGFRVDPQAEIWVAVLGRQTRLIKMILSRADFDSSSTSAPPGA
jgi:RimJ/RimL family protein N-acetyltransferase